MNPPYRPTQIRSFIAPFFSIFVGLSLAYPPRQVLPSFQGRWSREYLGGPEW